MVLGGGDGWELVEGDDGGGEKWWCELVVGGDGGRLW